MQKVIAITVVVVILVVAYYGTRTNTVRMKSPYDANYYNVCPDYDNTDEVLRSFSRLNAQIITLLSHMRTKYLSPGARHSKYIKTVVTSALYRYNPEVIYENAPTGRSTSYTVFKGVRLHICARQKDDPHRLVDYEVLKFVGLHELAHIAAFDVVDHPPQFWSVFKFVLKEAIQAGIYKPINFRQYKMPYCGMMVNYNPLYDNKIVSAEKLHIEMP